MAAATKEAVEVDVDGRSVRLTSLEKVMWPKVGFTKAGMLDYYSRIAETMLPYLDGRLLTLKRYPDGAEGKSFFGKACPAHRPEWLGTFRRYAESSDRDIDYCMADDRAALIWLANQSTIEFHVPMAEAETPDRPRAMVFDLDPGPGMTAADCADVALELRQWLKEDGLVAAPKSSGSKGVHVFVPLNTSDASFEKTKSYARELATELADQRGDVVAKMRKALRKDKVFIDWSQNSEHKTTVCPYSMRGRERPTVSAPLTWNEVEKAAEMNDPDLLLFESAEVLTRVEQNGDLFAEVLTKKQKLP